MGLVAMIEKLINEHGSAEIMEKRLALMKDEAAVMEKKFGELEADNVQLREELGDAKQRLRFLESKSREEAEVHLEELEVKAVMMGAKTTAGISAHRLVEECNTDQVEAEFYLEELVKKEFLIPRHFQGSPNRYFLNHKAREYLVRNKLMKNV